jgi:hypothetical protein
VIQLIDEIHGKRRLASEASLCADERLRHGIGNHHQIRSILKLIEADGYIEFTGKTRDRDASVTPKGREIESGMNRNESPNLGEE